MSFRAANESVGGFSGLFHEAGQGLIRIAGGWGNFPGPGIFMIRTILAGTTSAVTMGLAGSGLAAVFVGTASLPFLIFACAGFIFGSVGFYRNTLSRSLIALDRNPRLMQLHLDANYPDRGFLRFSDRQLRSEEFGRSWILQSMLVCSWLTAQPALDQLLESREQVITSESRDSVSSGEAKNG